MEALIDSLATGKIPLTWSLRAYDCERGLASWL